MRTEAKYRIAIGGVVAAVAAVAFAAASGDRLKAPVTIGQGTAVTEKVTFDIGSGSSNPFVQSTSGGTLQMSSDGTHLVSVGTVTGTASTLAGAETLTNKTINGSSNTLTVLGGTQISGQVPTTNGGTGVNGSATYPTSGVVVTEAATETLTNKTINGAALSGTLSGSPTFSGTPSFGTVTISTAINGGPTINSGGLSGTFNGSPTFTGAVTISGTAGNVPHACTIRSNPCGPGASLCLASCSGTEIVMGGGCTFSTNDLIETSYPINSTQWECIRSSAHSTGAGNIGAYAVCCAL